MARSVGTLTLRERFLAIRHANLPAPWPKKERPGMTNTDVQNLAFKLSDILVSRTDKRGVIEAGNEAFQRVSGYPWDKLHGAPHKLVRHEDMPKGVFHLFWSYLQQDKPIGAFVKNKTEDGKYYWVFAVASPLQDGYMSVRIKPSGPIFEDVQSLYATLLNAEKTEGLTPEQSAERLLDLLKDHGFDSYDAFMARAIGSETIARKEALNRDGDKILAAMNRVMEHWQIVQEEMRNTIVSFKVFEKLPVNMRIQAAQLGTDGIPLSVIASNFGNMTDSIEEMANDFLSEGTALDETLQRSLFLSALVAVQSEVVDLFRRETVEFEGVELLAEIARMEAQNEANGKVSLEYLKLVSEKADEFSDLFASVETFHSGISVTRVMAEIEIGQIRTLAASSLSAIVNELEGFLDNEGTRLNKMRSSLNRIRIDLRKALTEMRRRKGGRIIPYTRAPRARAEANAHTGPVAKSL